MSTFGFVKLLFERYGVGITFITVTAVASLFFLSVIIRWVIKKFNDLLEQSIGRERRAEDREKQLLSIIVDFKETLQRHIDVDENFAATMSRANQTQQEEHRHITNLIQECILSQAKITMLLDIISKEKL